MEETVGDTHGMRQKQFPGACPLICSVALFLSVRIVCAPQSPDHCNRQQSQEQIQCWPSPMRWHWLMLSCYLFSTMMQDFIFFEKEHGKDAKEHKEGKGKEQEGRSHRSEFFKNVITYVLN